jgi:hypothetical protein
VNLKSKIVKKIVRFLNSLLYKLQPRIHINLGDPEFQKKPHHYFPFVTPVDRELNLCLSGLEKGALDVGAMCRVDLAIKHELDVLEQSLKHGLFFNFYEDEKAKEQFLDFKDKFYGLDKNDANK